MCLNLFIGLILMIFQCNFWSLAAAVIKGVKLENLAYYSETRDFRDQKDVSD